MKLRVCAVLLLASLAQAIEPVDQLQFADGLYARGLYDMAVREYRALADSTNAPGADAALFRIGEARRQQEQAEAARAAYEETIARFPHSTYAVRARFRLAESQVQREQFAEAREAFLSLLKQPALPREFYAASLYYVAYAERRLDRGKDAEASYRRVLKEAGDSPYAQLARVELAGLRIAAKGKAAEIDDLLKDAAVQTNVPRAAAEALLLMGEHAYRRQQYEDSAAAYADYFARFPDHPSAAASRLPAAWAELKAGRASEALAQAVHAAEADAPDWLYLRANAQRLRGKPVEARTVYERLLDRHPASREFAPAAYELALLLMETRDFTNAYARARQAPLTDENRADLLWMRAETARETGRADEALALYDELLAQRPDPERAGVAQFSAARIAQETGSWAEASRRYRAVADLQPAHRLAADALFASAYCHTQRKATEEALADWKRLVEDHPSYGENDQAFFGMAQAEIALERLSAARVSLEALLKKYPSSALAPEAHLVYGSLLEQEENFAAAEFHYAQALRKQPAPALSRRIQFRRLGALQRQGRSDEAAEALNRLIAEGAHTEVPAALLDWAARWNLDRTNYNEAVAAGEALALRKENAAWVQLGWHVVGRARLAQGRADDAGMAFEKSARAAASTHEGLVSAWHWGDWAVGKEKWADAKTAFERAATGAATPETAEIRARSYFGLGRVAEGQGAWEDAARQYLAVAVLYDHPELTPAALEAAARAFERAGKPDEAENARREWRERYPPAEASTPGGDGS